MSVVIETTIGDLTVDLYTKERPRTCLNFMKLCKVKAYNFCLFSHVEAGFIAQTGDPVNAPKGGQSIFGMIYGEQARFFEAEKMPKIKHESVGTLSMVNVGDDMLGSQFFITLGENLDYLDGEHCVFGEVVEGFETLLKFNEVIADDQHIPYQDIRITHTVILDDPFDDPPGLEFPDRSPELTQEIFESGRIAPDEDLDEDYGRTAEEIEEALKEKEAKARATILEMVGDLPSVDVAPPENVLFVCKLNPVTTDEDLMIIFSRFGTIKSCEVIRDKKTGNSLQYAFIEFDNPKSCEDAYFKMDNVLIDDRRIHVDFSQSVATLRWKGKGRLEHLDERGDKAKPHKPPRFDDYQRKKNPERIERHNDERRRDDRHRVSYSSEKHGYRRDYSPKESRNDNRSSHRNNGRSRKDYDSYRDRRTDDRYRDRDVIKGSRSSKRSDRDRSRERERDRDRNHRRYEASDSRGDRDRKQKSSR